MQEQTWRDIRSRLRPGGRIVTNLGDMGLAATDPTTRAWKAMQAAFEGDDHPAEAAETAQIISAALPDLLHVLASKINLMIHLAWLKSEGDLTTAGSRLKMLCRAAHVD